MKRILVTFVLCFFVFGMMFNAPMLLADKDNGGNEKVGKIIRLTGSAVDDDKDDDREDGRERIRERVRDGEIERRVERRFIDAEGREVKIKRRIRLRDGEIEIRTELKVEGVGSNLSVEDSEGRKYRIRVTPEKLRVFIRNRLNGGNMTDLSLEEIIKDGLPRVAYKFDTEHPGKFLGIFKIRMRAQAIIDAEDGEVISFNVPWWAFLVSGIELPDEGEVVGNEDIEDEVVADDDELDEEFGDVEIEDNVEIEVEVKGDIGLSNEAQVTLDDLVSSFEGQEEKVELKLKVEKNNSEMKIESEVEGILTPDQETLWNSLIDQVKVIVEGADGDAELEIEIEHELDKVETEDEEDNNDETEEDDEDESNDEESTSNEINNSA